MWNHFFFFPTLIRWLAFETCLASGGLMLSYHSWDQMLQYLPESWIDREMKRLAQCRCGAVCLHFIHTNAKNRFIHLVSSIMWVQWWDVRNWSKHTPTHAGTQLKINKQTNLDLLVYLKGYGFERSWCGTRLAITVDNKYLPCCYELFELSNLNFCNILRTIEMRQWHWLGVIIASRTANTKWSQEERMFSLRSITRANKCMNDGPNLDAGTILVRCW